MGVGNLDPAKDTVPDEFQIRASKEKMVHRFLLGTKTTLDIHSYSKLSKLISLVENLPCQAIQNVNNALGRAMFPYIVPFQSTTG
jgi:hypothetical protein